MTTRKQAKRKLLIPDEFRAQARTSAWEIKEISIAVAEKLNRYERPVTFLAPTRGWSTLSAEGTELQEPETDAVLTPALKSHLRKDIKVIEKDRYVNDLEFAEEPVAAIDEMMNCKKMCKTRRVETSSLHFFCSKFDSYLPSFPRLSF